MEQAYDEVENTHALHSDALDLTEGFSDAELASQEIKPFQVAALIQEVERVVQEYPALQPDEVPLPA